MKARFLEVLQKLRASYWFVPALMVAGAVGLAAAVAMIGDEWPRSARGWPQWLITHDVDNARVVLATIAGSMITVAGVTFSIVIVALSLASSQFGPRLLVNFMRDTGNQVTLGTFIATFVYCILVLQQIGDEDPTAAILPLAVTLGVVLALISLGVLIYFFHHVSTSIQAEHVVADAGDLLERAVDAHFSQQPEAGTGDASDTWPEDFDSASRSIPAADTGYLNLVDLAALGELARDRDLRLAVAVRDGDFVARGSPVAHVYPAESVDESLADEIGAAFHLVRRRGTAEDVRLAVDRLTEIAVRALSPGINDPFTAIACIDRLGSGLALVAERCRSPSDGRDDEPRVRRKAPAVAELVDRPFQQLRIYGRDNPAVLVRQLEALGLVASRARDRRLREALLRQARAILAVAERLSLPAAEDRRIRRRCESVHELLGASSPAADQGAGSAAEEPGSE